MVKRKKMVKRTLFVKKTGKKEKVRVIEGLENAEFCIKIGKSEFQFVELAEKGESEDLLESLWENFELNINELEGKGRVWLENG